MLRQRLCPLCFQNLAARSGKSKSATYLYLVRHHRLECRALSFSSKEQTEEMKNMTEGMPGSFDYESVRSYEDYYVPGQMRSESNSFQVATTTIQGYRRRSVSPFAPSVDAIFPFHLRQRPNGATIGYHYPGNVAFTATYLNYMKHAFLPGALALVRQYHLDKGIGKDDNLPRIWNQVDALRTINVKVHHVVSTILTQLR